jgi:acyl-CoA thioesterase-1
VSDLNWKLGQAAVALALGVVVSFGLITQARANPATIVAIGADNVAGSGKGKRAGGVSRSEAFPAQLESQLRAKGIDASVTNAGVPGDTISDILARLDSAVPDGTQLVILDRPKGNDSQAGLLDAEDGYIDKIRDRLNARHIALIVLPSWQDMPGVADNRDPDGHHFTVEGHALIAAYLVPKVIQTLGAPPH